MPLTEIWNEAGTLLARWLRNLGDEEIKELLRVLPFSFVIADVGEKLRWINGTERFDFWIREVKEHLCSSDHCSLEDFPDEYYYRASEWLVEPDQRVIVLEKYH